ncbi:MAG: sigma-70 family RNA polymerase sigma factor [Bryobacterales bacterium]|nr:sigma-70 family RNA polymerase sigma factor [Bryobacterales bacterium]
MTEQPLQNSKKSVRKLRSVGWSDERLVRECLHGNDEAWSELIDKYKNLIYSIPLKHGIPADAAGEIFQQVCFELLTALPNLREAKTLAAWLITVTSRKCFDWNRHEQRYQSMDNETEHTLPEISKPSDTLLLELEREQILRESLRQIAPRCRVLIRMLFFDNPAVPYEQVAMSLGLAKGSIGFIRMRCLRQLRRVLEQKGFL